MPKKPMSSLPPSIKNCGSRFTNSTVYHPVYPAPADQVAEAEAEVAELRAAIQARKAALKAEDSPPFNGHLENLPSPGHAPRRSSLREKVRKIVDYPCAFSEQT